jgi:hypothetical protein
MKTFKSIIAVLLMSAAVTAGAQTLKMKPQVVEVTTTEISTVVSLVVVKPEIRIDKLDPSVLTVNTNGKDRNVLHVYPCDSRGAYNPVGEYLALGLDKVSGWGTGITNSRQTGQWNENYALKVALKPGKNIKVGKRKFTAIECETDKALENFLSEADYFNKGTYTGRLTGKPGDVTLTYASYEPWSLKSDGVANPLVIWLHGGGEGGVDVSITLLGNEVVSLIRPQIQSHFTSEGGKNGAYVLYFYGTYTQLARILTEDDVYEKFLEQKVEEQFATTAGMIEIFLTEDGYFKGMNTEFRLESPERTLKTTLEYTFTSINEPITVEKPDFVTEA